MINNPTFSAINSTNLNDFHSTLNNQWIWPQLTEIELKDAIFSNSTKKAPGPNKINFLLIQKAYATISQLFYQLYKKMIEIGFHPES